MLFVEILRRDPLPGYKEYNLDILLVCVVFALICALLLRHFHKGGWESRRLVVLGLFLLSLLGAWVARRLSPAAGAAQPVPFYKLLHIGEFGYQSLLTDLIAYALPFVHAAEMEKALFSADFTLAATHAVPVLLYSVLVTVVAVLCFLGQMKKQ